jgi:DNA modification methylase
MALLNGRNYIGSEISKEYCEIAEERIKNII